MGTPKPPRPTTSATRQTVTATTDPAHYFGATLSLTIDKQIATSATGPWQQGPITVAVGTEVWYKVTVTNTSNVPAYATLNDPKLGVTEDIGMLEPSGRAGAA